MAPQLRNRLHRSSAHVTKKKDNKNPHLIRVGDVVSFDFTDSRTGWIGVVKERGFINPDNKWERQIKVQPRRFQMIGSNFLLGESYGREVMQVLQQATKCTRWAGNNKLCKLELPDVKDNTYNSLRQLTNPDKLHTYTIILDHLRTLGNLDTSLLMESEMLSFTKFFKTSFPDALVDIPNPLVCCFQVPANMHNVQLHPSRMQDFILSPGCHGRTYDFVWEDLCTSLLHENADLLPLIVQQKIVKPGGYLAITGCLRQADYVRSMSYIKKHTHHDFEIVAEKKYWPSMLFVLLRRVREKL